MKMLFPAALLGVLPLVTFAHPGHGETEGFSIIHYFVEPDHMIYTWPLLILTVGVIAIAYRKRRKTP
jgi:hypothetical protein